MPESTQVLIAGGGPVGLAAAIELGRAGIECLVVEPRGNVSRARPRCKTLNVRTMELLRRWGIADRLRERAPLPTSWSQDVVFCTSLAGREISRFTGAFGLLAEGDRFPELGQQAPQYVLEELLRDVVEELPACQMLSGWHVVELEQVDGEVRVTVLDDTGRQRLVVAGFVIGCDGPKSTVREQIGSRYIGEQALRPNYNMVFESPNLWEAVRHGPAVQYWIINASAPALMGPIDRTGTWWIGALGIDAETGRRRASEIIEAAAGGPVSARIISDDPWTARMQLVDRARAGRVFLAGDAAHLNPPFGGHGLNTGLGDAIDLGWKLAAVLQGWGGPGLLESYERERRPLQRRVIDESVANMSVLSSELLADNLDDDDSAGESARRRAACRIQESKTAEFRSLDLVLGTRYEASPVIVYEEPGPMADNRGATEARAGGRLPHAWLARGRSIYDQLGPGFTLLKFGPAASRPADEIVAAAKAISVPLRRVDLPADELRERYRADLVLVRPDQYVAWCGDGAELGATELIDRVRGLHA